MATFNNYPRNNSAVKAFQWNVGDGEQLPYVKYFSDGDYYYFDNQQSTNNLFPIQSGDWVVQTGSGPNTRYTVMHDNDFRTNFNV